MVLDVYAIVGYGLATYEVTVPCKTFTFTFSPLFNDFRYTMTKNFVTFTFGFKHAVLGRAKFRNYSLFRYNTAIYYEITHNGSSGHTFHNNVKNFHTPIT